MVCGGTADEERDERKEKTKRRDVTANSVKHNEQEGGRIKDARRTEEELL